MKKFFQSSLCLLASSFLPWIALADNAKATTDTPASVTQKSTTSSKTQIVKANPAAEKQIMSYYSNWSPYSTVRPNYVVSGNADLQQKVKNLSIIGYAFFEAYPDGFVDANGNPINSSNYNKANLGKLYFSDPWSDLAPSDGNAGGVCYGSGSATAANHNLCFAGYEKTRGPLNLSSTDGWFDYGNFDGFSQLDTVNPKIKRIISLGGWEHDNSFLYGALYQDADVDGMQNFVNSVVDLIQYYQSKGNTHTVDGIDLDYEGDYNSDVASKMVLLTQKLRTAFNAHGWNDKIITMAVFANPEEATTFDGGDHHYWQQLSQYVDYFNLMGYDLHGAWDSPQQTGLQSNLYQDPNDPNTDDYTVDKAVEKYIELGVPGSKILVGIPSYGREVNGVTNATNNGLYQAFSGTDYGDMENPAYGAAQGQESYYNLTQQWLQPSGGYVEHVLKDSMNNVIGVWAYNASQHKFVSYDNTAAADTKANYILSKNLGGASMWELISDRTPSEVDPNGGTSVSNSISLLCHLSQGLWSATGGCARQ